MRVSLGVACAILTVMLAAPSAQRRGRADNASQGMPVATNAIVQDPEAFFGKLVTVTAGVEQMVSKTSFLIDQRKAAGASEVKAVGAPILVIAPYLTAAVERTHYLQVRGQIVKFDAATIGRVAAGYTLDLAPAVSAQYQGQPVLVANSVINSVSVELARKPILPPTADDVSLTAAMKIISPAFAALRTGAEASNADAVKHSAAALLAAFTQTETIWTAMGVSPAAELARQARTHVAAIENAAASGNWETVKTSAAAINQTCQGCHASYRERQEDGTFRLKRPPS